MVIKSIKQNQKEYAVLISKSPDPTLGMILDLDHHKYNNKQLLCISHGRGDNFEYGNIDDLDPNRYDDNQMYWVSLGRGKDHYYQNIDDLDPSENDYNDMYRISYRRGTT